MSDCISRQAAIDAANKLVDRFEQILRDIRETNEDESVCGLCEYDGAFIGQSGDWCNECPGFDKADCFKLSDERKKKWLKELELPSAQPERKKGRWIPVDSYSAFGGDEATWIAHGNPVAFYYCSECKEEAYAGEDGEPLLTDYCPNCGAYMRGEQDE